MRFDPSVLRHRNIRSCSRTNGLWTAVLTLCMALLWTRPAQTTPPIGTGDTIEFATTANSLGTGVSWDVALGDLDGDGDFDAFVTKNNANSVWTNDGAGVFTSSGQSLGNSESFGVALGDVDGDGDLDAFVANRGLGEPNRVWLNNGSGNFTDSGQTLGTKQSYDVSLADLDGDGDLDAFMANSRANKVWTNNGSGVFTDSGQSLVSSSTTISIDVALGDLDGDGDVDAFVANFASGGGAKPDTIWINNGSGSFASGGQLVSSNSRSVALGDVDGDGNLHAFVATLDEPDKVWLNNGSGGFTDSGQNFGSSKSSAVALGDLDGDGDLDVFVANVHSYGNSQPNKAWQNDGSGLFSAVAAGLESDSSFGVALGDLDGDGDLDAFIAKDGVDRVRENRSVHREAGAYRNVAQRPVVWLPLVMR